MEAHSFGQLKATTEESGARATWEKQDLRRLEEVSLNAWPALYQMLLDGWLMRFSGGYTKRANSINALYEGSAAMDRDIEARITTCEARYADHGLPAIFRITPFSLPSDLDERLAARGYRRFDATHVQMRDLAEAADIGSTQLPLVEMALDTWLETYAALAGRPVSPWQRAIVNAILPPRYLACMEVEGYPVACGMAVTEPPYVGLFSLITHPDLRRRGYGQALVKKLLAWGKEKDAKCAYLQVQEKNAPARALYTKLGFRDTYVYWYRARE